MQRKLTFEGLGTHPILGIILALGSAVLLGVTPSLSKIVYQEGGNVLSVVLVRSGFIPVISLFLYSKIIKQPLQLHKISPKVVLIAGLSMSMTAFGLMSSINYISPNLAVVILYSFPIIVLISVSILNRKLPSFKLASIYFVAFLGLVLAIGAKFDTISWFGVGLAFIAAAGASVIMFVGHIAGREVKSHSILFMGSFFVGVMAVLAILFTGKITFPASTVGWSALILAAICYTFGMLMVIVSTTVFRPDLATLFMNFEPFVGIVTAYLLLGHILTPLQLLGVFAVIIAISVGGVIGHREHMEPEDMTVIEHS